MSTTVTPNTYRHASNKRRTRSSRRIKSPECVSNRTLAWSRVSRHPRLPTAPRSPMGLLSGTLNSRNDTKKRKLLRVDKVYQAFTFLFCFVLFLWQMGMSMRRYWNYPVSTLITINSIHEVYLPSITMCNNNYRFYNMLLQLSGNANRSGSRSLPLDDLALFWQKHGVEKEQISVHVTCDFYIQYNRNLTLCEDFLSRGELTTDLAIQTILGQCVDLTLNYPAHQRILGIGIRIEDNSNIRSFYNNYTFKEYYNIYAHDSHMLYKNDIFINTRAPQNIELWLSFEKKEYLRLNSPNNPCQEVKSHIHCLNECVENKLIRLVHCRLPHMISTSDLPMCANWSDVLTVYKVIHRLHATGELYECSCTRACRAVEFKVNRIESMKLLANETNVTVMSIELENRFDENVEERYVYPFSMLINDFSALIGFFMGVSLPALINVAEVCGKRLLVYCQTMTPKSDS